MHNRAACSGAPLCRTGGTDQGGGTWTPRPASGEEDLHVVCLQLPIGRHQTQVLCLRLRDEHPVEGIPMMCRQLGHPQGMRMFYGQRLESLTGKTARDEIGRSRRKHHLAQRMLDCDFP